jgi:hypothetical protein
MNATILLILSPDKERHMYSGNDIFQIQEKIILSYFSNVLSNVQIL